jgi:hypothetical protein
MSPVEGVSVGPKGGNLKADRVKVDFLFFLWETVEFDLKSISKGTWGLLIKVLKGTKRVLFC